MFRNLINNYVLVLVALFCSLIGNSQTAKYLVVSKLAKVMNGSPNPNGVFDTTYGYQIGSTYNFPFSGSYVDGPTVIFRNERQLVEHGDLLSECKQAHEELLGRSGREPGIPNTLLIKLRHHQSTINWDSNPCDITRGITN